ncbi:MAG: phenylalanine--tRNA ligase subunit beta [Bdellovibrionales bacterium]|nr:phenylalanine--tRNA ligase subunit beta [Bdellovibrionales bacterium]
MKISLRWLSEYIEIADYLNKPEELGEILTRAGLEVEDLQKQGKDLHHVYIGCVLEKSKHPNADKLSLCRVTTGEGQVHQIVCGAQNHKTGDRVAVALPGAVLPGGFAIQKSEIRGVESHGMLCSYKELGVTPTQAEGSPPSTTGIIIFPEDAPIGKTYVEYAGLDDVIFEFKVTPNRADCLSHYGLARELSALLSRPLKPVQPELQTAAELTSAHFKVEVKAQDLCPRYTGRLIRQVKVGPSPEWLRKRLEAVGLASINNIVDTTNFVLMELGQPLHAFDASQIQGHHLVIDRARAGESFVSLDGTTLTLKGDELTIRDPEKVLCLAGTIGGKNSGVSETTTTIFLESAFFVSQSVRRTARGHGIETESSYRFSRGVDAGGVSLALDRATELILKLAGGEATQAPFDIVGTLPERKWIAITADLISQRMGYLADAATAAGFFKRLGCEVKTPSGVLSGKSIIEVKAPSFRFDLEQEMDLVEEYARLRGYSEIPETLPPNQELPTGHDPVFEGGKKIGSILRSVGFSQAWNFAFAKESHEKNFLGDLSALKATGLSMSPEWVRVLNPLNEDLNVLRGSLVNGLFQNAKLNSHRGNSAGRLFEIGMTFGKTDGGIASGIVTGIVTGRAEKLYTERWRLGLISWGFSKSVWNQKPLAPQVFEVKAALSHLLNALGVMDLQWHNGEFSKAPSFLHAGQWAELSVGGHKVGFIGTLHPQILEEEKIREPVAVGEIELEFCLDLAQSLSKGQVLSRGQTPRTLSISKFPAVDRDFAFLMPVLLPAESVAIAMKDAAGPLCLGVEVFDVYQGPELPAGYRSVAFSMRLQGESATLQESEIQGVQERVLAAVRGKYSLSPR